METPTPAPPNVDRKVQLRRYFDDLAPRRRHWRDRNRYFYEDEVRYLRQLIPPGSRVLEVGCGTGDLLAALDPSEGLGVDLSPTMVAIAQEAHAGLRFVCGDIEDPDIVSSLGGPFDYIVISDTIGYLEDIQRALGTVRKAASAEARIVLSYFSQAWRPLLRLASAAGLKTPDPSAGLNWLSSDDLVRLLDLADFDVVARDWRLLLPRRAFGLGPAVNGTIGSLPGLRRLALRDYVVARPRVRDPDPAPLSCSVVVPCRNESGNIAPLVTRMPHFPGGLEIIFVEGGSADATVEEIELVMAANPERDIKLIRQTGRGKADAVWDGFDAASGDVLMILDADMTVPPEDLPKFYRALATRRGEFINGTRLVYPLHEGAMRRFNFIANHLFARLFSWLINQRVTDTLCGTKALSRDHYRQIVRHYEGFGETDPFGDFDLLLGAAQLGLEIVEVPVRYHARTYGSTQISRFTDGWKLARMFARAWRRAKVA